MARNKRNFLTQPKPGHPVLRGIIRWILYLLCIFLAFVTANAGDYTKPLLLIPIALCISSVSGKAVSVGIGIFCGFLLDISLGTLLGYHAIIMLFLCLITGILYDRLLMQRFWNMFFLTAAAAFLVTGLDYIFQYAVWGYENIAQIYLTKSLRCFAYTTISSAIFYPIFTLIHRYLLMPGKRMIEKKTKPPEETE